MNRNSIARLVDTGGLSLVYIAALEILKRNRTIKNLEICIKQMIIFLSMLNSSNCLVQSGP